MKQEKLDFLLKNRGQIKKVDTIFNNLSDFQKASIKKDIITMLNQPKAADDSFIRDVMARLFGCENYQEWENLSKHVEGDVKDVFVNKDRVQGFYDDLNESFEIFVSDLENNIKLGKGSWINLLKLKVEPVICVILQGDQTDITLEEFQLATGLDKEGNTYSYDVDRILKRELKDGNTIVTFVPKTNPEDDGIVLNKPI